MGISIGRLDQLQRCFEVQFAAGRDLRPGQLGSMIQTLSNCMLVSMLHMLGCFSPLSSKLPLHGCSLGVQGDTIYFYVQGDTIYFYVRPPRE
ncbi:hypothetical protein CMV_016504 [Castanea mollissima]|uniref:Uncharacterized protein n=1 Tax=Castanea mollissima TaxID=60419 RepID=A0A8J4QTP9_9ROSI|nr:hypothetical protein CMV_016504 [Castanea mollissima]